MDALLFQLCHLIFLWFSTSISFAIIFCPFDQRQNFLYHFSFTDRSFFEESLLGQRIFLQGAILVACNADLLINVINKISVMLLAIVASFPFCVHLANGLLELSWSKDTNRAGLHKHFDQQCNVTRQPFLLRCTLPTYTGGCFDKKAQIIATFLLREFNQGFLNVAHYNHGIRVQPAHCQKQGLCTVSKNVPANMSVAVVPQCSTMYSVPFVCTHVNMKRILLPMFMCILYSCMFCAHLIAPTLAFQAAPSMHTKALHRYVSEQKQEHSLSLISNFSLENIQKTLSKRPFSCNLNFVYLKNGCGTMRERNLEAINLSGSKYLANSVNYSIHSIGC